jgi:hypothetical protein
VTVVIVETELNADALKTLCPDLSKQWLSAHVLPVRSVVVKGWPAVLCDVKYAGKEGQCLLVHVEKVTAKVLGALNAFRDIEGHGSVGAVRLIVRPDDQLSVNIATCPENLLTYVPTCCGFVLLTVISQRKSVEGLGRMAVRRSRYAARLAVARRRNARACADG